MKGLNPLFLQNYLKRPETLEFALAIERDLKGVESTNLELVRDSILGTATIEGGKLTVIKKKMESVIDIPWLTPRDFSLTNHHRVSLILIKQ